MPSYRVLFASCRLSSLGRLLGLLGGCDVLVYFGINIIATVALGQWVVLGNVFLNISWVLLAVSVPLNFAPDLL